MNNLDLSVIPFSFNDFPTPTNPLEETIHYPSLPIFTCFIKDIIVHDRNESRWRWRLWFCMAISLNPVGSQRSCAPAQSIRNGPSTLRLTSILFEVDKRLPPLSRPH